MPSDSRRPALHLERLLHPDEQDQFRSLCQTTEAAEFPGLRTRVTDHLARVNAHAAVEGSRTDAETARRIAEVLDQLLRAPEAFDADARALVRGAVDYFVLSKDGRDDLNDLIGFDDDLRITNAVLEAIDRNDLVLDLT